VRTAISFLGSLTPVQGRVARTRRRRRQYTSVWHPHVNVYAACTGPQGGEGVYCHFGTLLRKISGLWIDRVPQDVKRGPMATFPFVAGTGSSFWRPGMALFNADVTSPNTLSVEELL